MVSNLLFATKMGFVAPVFWDYARKTSIWRWIHTWCFQDWFYFTQPSSNHDPALRKSKVSQTLILKGWNRAKFSQRSLKVFASSSGFLGFPSQTESKYDKGAKFAAWMDAEWWRTTCEKEATGYKASSVWWPSKWDEPPFLTCHCRFRCRSLTLTFQGMSSKLAESLNIENVSESSWRWQPLLKSNLLEVPYPRKTHHSW